MSPWIFGGEGLTLVTSLLGLATVALATLLYLRAEPLVPGRALLLGSRVVALSILTALLLDLEIPGIDPSRPAPAGGKWVIVDPDLSLDLPGEGGGSLWDELLDTVRASAEDGARLALALPGNGGVEGLDVQGLEARGRTSLLGDLNAAVARLGEAGADSVVLLSTLRRRPAEIEALTEETPLPVRLLRIGETSRNVGVGDLQLPAIAASDEELTGRVELFGEGGEPGDSVRVEIRADGDLIRVVYSQVPLAGEQRSLPLALPPPPDSGLVRYTARGFLDGDLFPADDLRARWVVSGRASPEILLVSLRPDWEPRVLLPVLEAVTGLRGRGYLSLPDGRFLPLGGGAEEIQPVPSGDFRDGLPNAEILVIHGSVDDPPEWLMTIAEDHPRVLHLPDTRGGAMLGGLEVDSARGGEWVPASELPPSPLAPFLAGVSLVGLPPLSDLLPLTGSHAGVVGLNAQGTRNETPTPALVLLETERGRRAVTLADGFWRWGVRDGEARRAYRSLWGGVTAWLLERRGARPGELVRPETVIQARDEPLRWEVPSDASDFRLSMSQIHDGGEDRVDSESGGPPGPSFIGSLQVATNGGATSPSIEPGVYRYEIRGSATTPPDSIVANGIVEVERWAGSLRLPPLDFSDQALAAGEGANTAGVQVGRPLRTHPLPYVLLLTLLGAEWVGRRRAGLR